MKRALILAGGLLLCTAAMGLASRDWRSSARADGELADYDAPLQYYEQIRPTLVSAQATLSALCHGDRAEGGRTE
jgi:hypothetical protein